MEVSVRRKLLYLTLGLMIAGVAMRLLPHLPNLAPVGAIALFGGALLPLRYAWWLPLGMMVVSDGLIGFYDGILYNWLGFMAVTAVGLTLRSHSSIRQVAYGTLGASIAFYLISNFGVWLQGGLYAHTWAGLVECYAMALPFLRNTFLGDMIYGGLLFGGYALAVRYWRVEAQKFANT